jgi:hypothetical protein
VLRLAVALFLSATGYRLSAISHQRSAISKDMRDISSG